jgi:hypothetical protein
MRLSATILLTFAIAATAGCAKSPTDQQTSTTQQNSTTGQTASASPAPGLANVNATPNASSTPDAAQATKSDVDPCALLTSDEIRAVQGEPLKETKPSRQSASGLVGLQCYYALPTSANSVSLALTETDPANPGTTARRYWQKTFHNSEEAGPEREGRNGQDEKEKGRDEKKKESTQKSPGGREEEGEATPPKPVRGLGDEAFWTASRFGGALYVLKGQRFIRLSVGGAGDEQTRLTKTETLARAALRRL